VGQPGDQGRAVVEPVISPTSAALPACDHIETELHGPVALLRISRPGKLNALTGSGGRSFSAGGDIELALACDIVLAAEHAAFGLPEASFGLVPGFGILRAPAVVGRQAVAMLYGTQDAAEGIAAFAERREPRFEGR
jgi:enoyl-CoA hydratase/carnithine racemase